MRSEIYWMAVEACAAVLHHAKDIAALVVVVAMCGLTFAGWGLAIKMGIGL